MCGKSDGGVRGEGAAASRIGFEPLSVCNGVDRMTDEIREEAPWTMMFADSVLARIWIFSQKGVIKNF